MFKELNPLLNQCKSIKLDITPQDNGELLVIMQSHLKPLETNASEGAKQLHGALAMPLVLKAPINELESSFTTLLSEYCQQHQQTQSSLEISLERVKENNKAARQTASTLEAKASEKQATKKTATTAPPSSKKTSVIEPVTQPNVESVTAQSNPVSLF